jgi:Immunoglobulin-like domain of bacterial spore germination
VNTPLSELLRDAVDGIEPSDRLAAIREQAASAPVHEARRWWYAAGGVVLATAAAVTAFAVLGSDDDGDGHDHVATPSGTQLVAAYFLGDTDRGERLFREFDEVPSGDSLQAALDRIERPAADPDYRTPWTATSFGDVMLMDGVIHVEVEDAVLDDDLAVQQVVYTLQAAAQERLPVRLGDTTYEARPQNDVLSLVSISDPTEGMEYHDVLLARGRANSFEATVPWAIRDEDGRVVREGSAMAEGAYDRLYPWEARIDVSGLPAGFYTFEARTDDPTTEGPGPDTDTRTIIVR